MHSHRGKLRLVKQSHKTDEFAFPDTLGDVSASVLTSTLRERVKQLVPEFQKRLREPEAVYPKLELAQLAQCGALAAPLPEQEGGEGWGIADGTFRDLLLLLYDVGRANLVLGRIFEGHVNALQLIAQYGTREQIRRTAEDVQERNAVFGVWNTGPQGKPEIEETGESIYRLSSGKTFASGVGRIDRAVVTGNLAGGWQMMVLPLNEISYRIDYDSWQPFGMEASGSFAVDFTGAEVSGEDLLGDKEDYYREPFFTGGAFRFSAVQLGGASALLEFTRDFLRETGRANDPHQLARLGRIAVAVQGGRQWIEQSAQWLESKDLIRVPARAHMTRTAAADICSTVMDLVEVSIGARGLLAGQPFRRMLRDLRMYLRQAGADNAVTSIGRSVVDKIV